ncbi:uncharacterized protein LOC141637760 [Silene latifolia]|uniref:uncharacterized protein LOC141637760 n=1 Tax=Silene latifolia TaxID=37657 RepID=UPI003D77ACE2
MERNGNFGKALAHGAWKKVVEAKTFDECTMEWNELRKKYCCHPALISYLELTWWHKIHMFGKCFTNLVLHFGNRTTSRVESAHAQLKMWLGSAELTLDSIWKRADVMLHGQHIEIRKTLEDSISKTVVTNMYYGNIFSMLSGRVSATVIEAMLVEYNRGTDLGYYLEENCGCTLWTTHKLLCACRLHTVFHEGKKIHPDDLHVFWSRLAYTDSSHRRSRHNDVMEDLFDKVRAAHHSVQRDVIESLFSKLYPEDEVIEEPEIKDTRRGRPRKSNTRNKSAFEHSRRSYPSTSTSNGEGGDGPPLELNYNYVTDVGLFDYQHCMPEAVIDGFLGFFNPEGDGHCGFRVMSHAKTGNQKNYLEMRKQLMVELQQLIYMTIYYGERNSACRRIKWAYHTPCHKPNWMEANDLHGFATLFNWTICFVTLQVNLSGDRVWTGSNTYLPLRPVPGVRAPYGILWILFTGNHFVRLRMDDNCVMPPISDQWINNRHNDVAYYKNIYTERLDLWWQFVFSGIMFNPFT